MYIFYFERLKSRLIQGVYMERLQKRIADSGYTSRRKAERLIQEGKVTVNDVLVTDLGVKVSKNDIIKINNQLLPEKPRNIYLALNKPQGYITSTEDELNRKTIMDLIPAKYKEFRLYPVGRLDNNTTGIILLTNDGEFKNQIAGPKSGIEKEYLVRVEGIVKTNEVKILSQGIKYQGEQYLPSIIRIESIDKEHNSTLLTCIITDGKNHEIKNMFSSINHPVKKLKRVRYGVITIDNLPEKMVRELTIHEIKLMFNESKKEKNMKGR